MDRIEGNIYYSMSKIDFRWYMNYDFFVWYCCLYFWWYCMNKGYIVYGIFIVFLILYVSGIVNVYREGVCWWVIIIVYFFDDLEELMKFSEGGYREREREYYNLFNVLIWFYCY